MPTLGRLGSQKLIFVTVVLGILFFVTREVSELVQNIYLCLSFPVWTIVFILFCFTLWKQFQRWDKKSMRLPSLMAQDFQDALEALGVEMNSYLAQEHLPKTVEEDDFGWLLRKYENLNYADISNEFHKAHDNLWKIHWWQWRPKMCRFSKCRDTLKDIPLDEGTTSWKDITIILIPGLYTTYYPGYMTTLRYDLDCLQIDYIFSKIGTNASVEDNGKILIKEMESISEKKKIVIGGHSKGSIDFLEAIAVKPALQNRIYSFVSLQGVFGGSPVIQDLGKKKIVTESLKTIFGGDGECFYDCGFERRKKWHEKHRETFWLNFPTICFATSACQMTGAVLSPVVELFRYRYGEATDGCVAKRDAILPGSMIVTCDDADHYAPAWKQFPANDNYDPTKLLLLLISLSRKHYKKEL